MATLIEQPEAEAAEVAKTEATGETQNARVLLAVAILLCGLSIAIPAAMMAFVWPYFFEIMAYRWDNGPRPLFDPTWWLYLFTAIALSVGCGVAAMKDASRSRVARSEGSEGQIGKTSRWPATGASVAMILAVLALIIWPIPVLLEVPGIVGVVPMILGLAGIALAVCGVAVTDPAATRRWLMPFTRIALGLTLLGNAFMLYGSWFSSAAWGL